jgi:ribonuclease BN (tRNA processing enzyme)
MVSFDAVRDPYGIVGPKGTEKRTRALMDLMFPGSGQATRHFAMEFVELRERTPTPVGPAVVSAIPVEQPDTPACALRVEYAGAVVIYTGDTAWSEDLIELARGADLLITEAYFFERDVP